MMEEMDKSLEMHPPPPSSHLQAPFLSSLYTNDKHAMYTSSKQMFLFQSG